MLEFVSFTRNQIHNAPPSICYNVYKQKMPWNAVNISCFFSVKVIFFKSNFHRAFRLSFYCTQRQTSLFWDNAFGLFMAVKAVLTHTLLDAFYNYSSGGVFAWSSVGIFQSFLRARPSLAKMSVTWIRTLELNYWCRQCVKYLQNLLLRLVGLWN